MSDIEWVDELPPSKGGKGGRGHLARFVEQIREHPGVWAKYGTRGVTGTTDKTRAYPGTEWAQRTINGEKVLFGRWVGPKQEPAP